MQIERLPLAPSAVRHIGSVAGRLVVPAFGAYMGAYLMLNGAEQTVEIDSIRATISTEMSPDQPGLYADIELQPATGTDRELGGIAFPQFISPLPIQIHSDINVETSTVESAIAGKFDYAQSLETEAMQAKDEVTEYFMERFLLGTGGGILAGIAINELLAVDWRRFNSRQKHWAVTTGHAAVALSVLGAGGAIGASHIQPDISHYEGSGLIGFALSSPDGFDHINLENETLERIFQEFQDKNACPGSSLPDKSPYGALDVTTYNIKRGNLGMLLVTSQLAVTDSDIILLQEATPESVDLIAERLDMQAVTGWTIDDSTDVFGNAILSDLPVIDTRSYPLPTPEDVEARSLITATLRLPDGTTVVVGSTHLSNERMTMRGDDQESIRHDQANAIADIAEEMSTATTPFILGLDMNDSTSSVTYKTITTELSDSLHGFDEVANAASHPANGQRFDGIYSNTSWEVVGASRGGREGSDHCSESVTFVPDESDLPYVASTDSDEQQPKN